MHVFDRLRISITQRFRQSLALASKGSEQERTVERIKIELQFENTVETELDLTRIERGTCWKELEAPLLLKSSANGI